MSIIECEQVSICYGRKAALKNLDFTLHPGECLGLVGLNGAGKTSLLKALLDFTEIQAGQIKLFGQDHTQPAARAELAYLPEQFLPAEYLRGEDFLHYLLDLYQAKQPRTQIDAMCSALDLDKQQLKQAVSTYSKGTRQKLGLLACFLSNKSLLILDEPMSGLDPKARALTFERIKQHQQNGKSLLLSAHYLEDVGQLCDRLLVLHEGQNIFLGTPAAFLKQFASDHLEQAFLRCIE